MVVPHLLFTKVMLCGLWAGKAPDADRRILRHQHVLIRARAGAIIGHAVTRAHLC